jgi:ABC-2 type transport system ATP-binding protein
MTLAIETRSLVKQFGRGKRLVRAVQQLDLQVYAGQVYGFLGPNGAGKTTTIRMLLDLIRPSSGAAFLFGKPATQGSGVLQSVGALVEGATFYPYLSGRKNLEVLARTGGYYDAGYIQQLIDLVGMSDRADRPTRGYSTGMKQRMGVAAALLSKPELVILDEPTNGLDPSGIQDMRVLIRKLVDEQGKTVFLSSHMLNEVEQICDRVAIINGGRIVREGAVSELLAAQTRVHVEAEPLTQAQAILSEHWQISADGDALLLHAERSDVPHIIRKLVEQQIAVYEVGQRRQTLEEYFLSATQEATHD